jgi:hypothetical protein
MDFRHGRNQNVEVKVKVSRRHRRSSRRIPCSSISYRKDTAYVGYNRCSWKRKNGTRSTELRRRRQAF